MNRRSFLNAIGAAGLAAAVVSPERLWAAAANESDWTLGFGDVMADVAPRALRLVHGKPPVDLAGVLYRNGPGRFRRPGGSVSHWFDGDGLIRRFAIEGGQATLAARFADTPKRRADEAAGAVVTAGFGTARRRATRIAGPDDLNAANTSVMMAGGELWALWEGGSPTAMDPATLETRGFRTLRADLKSMPFLAHPRREPDGRVWNLGVFGSKAIVWRLDADGVLEAATPIDLPRASYVHDFTATGRHLVIVLQPWLQEKNIAPLIDGFAWRPEQGTQVLVLDKADLTRRRLYQGDTLFAFHMGDAWEDGDGTIRFDICAEAGPQFALHGARMVLEGRGSAGLTQPQLTMVSLRPGGRMKLEPTGLIADFPRTDSRFAGRRRRYTVLAGGMGGGHPLAQAVSVRDWKRDETLRFDFGPRQMIEEMVFVPRSGGSAEFDGWLVGTGLNLDEKATELHVFDARRVEAGPVCSWRSDVALPVTFHGVFAGKA